MPKFELKIDLNALNHLGLNLYSNVPAVLSELIANAWDADAGEVCLDISTNDSGAEIVVRDDGCGMDVRELNGKFLTVGYQRRKNTQGDLTPKQRMVMGRKGIGKLSVFSIADYIQVYTRKNGTTVGLELDVELIRRDIENNNPHHPRPLTDIPPVYKVTSETGTVIVLSQLKKRILKSIDRNLRKRVARRFSVWSEGFRVLVNGKPVLLSDRDYFSKLEYALVYNGFEHPHLAHLSESDRITRRDYDVTENYQVKGWIGLVKESGSLQEGDENLNKLSILVRGKLASEDILETFREGGLYTKYLIGELEADFLDLSDKDDIATSSRQDFLRSDDRFIALRRFIGSELKHLEKSRADYKKKEGVQRAKELPEINEWFQELKGDARTAAEKLFARINTIVTDDKHRGTLYKHGILAFEHLHHKEKLSELNNLNIQNLEVVVRLFSELDDIEASWYYQITRGRLDVILKLKEYADGNAYEKIIQKHIYSHLWLLDPSWDRATETAHMEKSIRKAFVKLSNRISEEEERGRIDIRYKKSSGKHIIIELKRPNVRTKTLRLLDQVEKYRQAVREEARKAEDGGPIETICLVGTELQDWKTREGREESGRMLQAKNVRVVTYQQLIRDAEISYNNYLEKSKEKGRIAQLLEAIGQRTST